jgi:isoleucyl-tRNA synthetase
LVGLADLIASELNVKDVRFSSEVHDLADVVIAIVPSVLGPRLGGATQAVIGAARRGEWSRTPEGDVEVAGVRLSPSEYALQLRPRDEAASRVLPGGDGLVVLDLGTDHELEAEGVARDLVRLIQQARRDAGLNVSDRITLRLGVSPATADAVRDWLDYVSGQVLADAIHLDTSASGAEAPVKIGFEVTTPA